MDWYKVCVPIRNALGRQSQVVLEKNVEDWPLYLQCRGQLELSGHCSITSLRVMITLSEASAHPVNI